MTEASPQRANMGFIGAIVAVATIGGFLFGYDSGAVNGTQEGLTASAFDLIPAAFRRNGLGFTVGIAADRLLHRGLLRRSPGRPDGRRKRDDACRGAVPGRRARPGFLALHLMFVSRDCRRHGGRRGQRAVARLHFRSRAGEHPRPNDDRPADHDHHRPDRAFLVNYFLAATAGRFDRRSSGAGLEAWRWMYLMQAIPPRSSWSPCSSFRRARATWSPKAATRPRRAPC
jgi:SP family sugar:H+ symporter-like MFS transporter